MTVNGFHINSLMYPRMSSETGPTQTSTASNQANTTTTTTHVHANMVTSSQGSANQENCQGGMMGQSYFQDYSFGHGQTNGQQNASQLAATQDTARRSPPALQMAFNAVMQANQAATNQTAQNLLNSQSESPVSQQENSNMAHFISGMLQERQNQMVRDRSRAENQNKMANAQRTIAEQERAIQEQNTINEQTKNVQTQQQYSIQQILFYLQQSQVHTLNFIHANMKPKSNQGKYPKEFFPCIQTILKSDGAQAADSHKHHNCCHKNIFQSNFKIISTRVRARHQINHSKLKETTTTPFQFRQMKTIKR